MKFNIPVTYHVFGVYFNVEADTIEQAIEKVHAADPPCDSLPPYPEYIDDSMEVNMDVLREEHPEYFPGNETDD